MHYYQRAIAPTLENNDALKYVKGLFGRTHGPLLPVTIILQVTTPSGRVSRSVDLKGQVTDRPHSPITRRINGFYPGTSRVLLQVNLHLASAVCSKQHHGMNSSRHKVLGIVLPGKLIRIFLILPTK